MTFMTLLSYVLMGKEAYVLLKDVTLHSKAIAKVATIIVQVMWGSGFNQTLEI